MQIAALLLDKPCAKYYNSSDKNNNRRMAMKKDIHPNYHEVVYECACGAKFVSGSTKKGDVVKVDICSECHPFYTGKHTHKQLRGNPDVYLSS